MPYLSRDPALSALVELESAKWALVTEVGHLFDDACSNETEKSRLEPVWARYRTAVMVYTAVSGKES